MADSSERELPRSFRGCAHFRRRGDTHEKCQTCRMKDGLPLCTRDSPCGVCCKWNHEDWLLHEKNLASKEKRRAAKLRKSFEAEDTEDSIDIHPSGDIGPVKKPKLASTVTVVKKASKTKAASTASVVAHRSRREEWENRHSPPSASPRRERSSFSDSRLGSPRQALSEKERAHRHSEASAAVSAHGPESSEASRSGRRAVHHRSRERRGSSGPRSAESRSDFHRSVAAGSRSEHEPAEVGSGRQSPVQGVPSTSASAGTAEAGRAEDRVVEPLAPEAIQDQAVSSPQSARTRQGLAGVLAQLDARPVVPPIPSAVITRQIPAAAGSAREAAGDVDHDLPESMSRDQVIQVLAWWDSVRNLERNSRAASERSSSVQYATGGRRGAEDEPRFRTSSVVSSNTRDQQRRASPQYRRSPGQVSPRYGSPLSASSRRSHNHSRASPHGRRSQSRSPSFHRSRSGSPGRRGSPSPIRFPARSRSRSPLVGSPAHSTGSPVRFPSPILGNRRELSLSREEDQSMPDVDKVTEAQYESFRRAVTTSKAAFKTVPATTRRANRVSSITLGAEEKQDRVVWADQSSLQDVLLSTARQAQGLKEDASPVNTPLTQSFGQESSFKFFTVKSVFPKELYRLRVDKEATYQPKPPAVEGFGDLRMPGAFSLPTKVQSDTEELARRASIYASVADSMMGSVIAELVPEDQMSAGLVERLRIIQEAQVGAMAASVAVASNLQLVRRDAVLKHMNLPQSTISRARTAPFVGTHVLGPEPKEFARILSDMKKEDALLSGKSGHFATPAPKKQRTQPPAGSASQSSVFRRLGPAHGQESAETFRDSSRQSGQSGSHRGQGLGHGRGRGRGSSGSRRGGSGSSQAASNSSRR